MFLPVIVAVILRIKTTEQSIAFKAGVIYTEISSISAATKFGVIFTVQMCS